MASHVRLRLAPVPESVRAARHAVAAFLARHGGGRHADTAALLVSELVTNAVLHADTEISVSACLAGGVLQVEVGDGHPGMPVRRDYETDATTGRGMALLAVLADCHGVERAAAGDGKTVWFYLGGHAAADGPRTCPEAPERDRSLAG